MGIDVTLHWHGMTEADQDQQHAAQPLLSRGRAGYIREGYGISPHPVALLVPEAFDSPDGTATIAAATMRERLYRQVTEPASRATGRNAHRAIAWLHHAAAGDGWSASGGPATFTPTQPGTVWEAVQQRVAAATACGALLTAEQLMQQYVGFVEAAERHEREQGRPCCVHVSD